MSEPSNHSALGESFLRSAQGIAATPTLDDLAQSFTFDPANADIRLANRRMLLTDDLGLGILRRELIWALGHERARGVISRMGYGIGVTDAQFAQDLRKGATLRDIYKAGPQLHALKGVVNVEEIAFTADFDKGEFYGEYIWHNSAECQSHVHEMGVGTQPAGWQQCGYASGFATTFFGRPMVFREVECIAMGHSRCYLIGKPADAWDNADEELRWFRAETYSHRPGKSAARPTKKADSDLVLGSRSIVGASSAFNHVLHLVDKVAQTEAPVLFMGESGVGKEVFARELHKRSRRAEGPLVALNCAALPETLFEAELFGVERGAFTGAESSRAGRFERATGGTLFLDEIGTLSLSAQSKLLRVLQEGEYERVGGSRLLRADIRLVAATNADLRAGVTQGTFRADLYHRISTFPVHIPPLRERRGDIPVLAHHFLQRLCRRHGRPSMRFDADVVRYFHEYSWPGNVREMENLIERGIILAQEDEAIGIHHLTLGIGGSQGRSGGESFQADTFEDFIQTRARAPSRNMADIGERLLDTGLSQKEVFDQLLHAALERHNGNVSAAARALGMSRAQVQYWKDGR